MGTVHDFELLKLEFWPQLNWFKDKRIRLDSGFQGFEGLYQTLETVIPVKKPRGKELSEEQKKANQEKSSKRVIVEHSIAGLKRFRILSDRLRLHTFRLYDEIIGICAGLWNLIIA